MAGMSKTARFYRRNKKAREKHRRDNIEINRGERQTRNRVESNKARRQAKKRGVNLNGKDMGHKNNGKLVPVNRSANRGRYDQNGVNAKNRRKSRRRRAG